MRMLLFLKKFMLSYINYRINQKKCVCFPEIYSLTNLTFLLEYTVMFFSGSSFDTDDNER